MQAIARVLKLSRYLVVSDCLTIDSAGESILIVFSTRSGSVVSINPATWGLLERGDFDRLPVAAREELISAQILVPSQQDELEQVIGENIAEIDRDDTLYHVVQPTAWCQLDCHYCGQEHSKQQLGDEEQDALLLRLRKKLGTGRYRTLSIGWFGAEPLAGMQTIRALTPRLVALALEFNCDYSARIVTNGVALDANIARELAQSLFVVEAEVTLDGIEEAHDERRMHKSGAGSYRRIYENLLSIARSSDLAIVVRCNVDRSNEAAVAPLIEALADAGLERRISFYTSPVYAWGNDAQRASLSSAEYAEKEVEWLALQLRLGFKVGLLPPRRKIVCMAVQPDSEVLDAYGNTFNCTEVPYVPAYGEPNIYSIGLPGGRSLSIGKKPTQLRSFNDQIAAHEHSSCSECRMLPVCGGQCPKAWHEGNPPCPSTKLNISQRLNLLFALSRMSD